MIKVIRYTVKEPHLQPYIKFFWHLTSKGSALVHHRMLPVNNVDLIINRSAPITYVHQHRETCPSPLHFNGIQTKAYEIRQEGILDVIGIAFRPGGFYPFIQKPLHQFQNQVINLNDVKEELADRLQKLLGIFDPMVYLEKELACFLDKAPDTPQITLLQDMLAEDTSIASFCVNYGINRKYLERVSLKYGGASPKRLQKITRFQKASSALASNHNTESLTNLAQNLSYYDQTHFIKEFKAFSSDIPTKFQKEKLAVRQIAETSISG